MSRENQRTREKEKEKKEQNLEKRNNKKNNERTKGMNMYRSISIPIENLPQMIICQRGRSKYN